MQHPPTAYFEKSKSALGIPQMIFRKLPVVPQEGQGAVLIDIFLDSFMRLNLYKGTDTPTLKSLPTLSLYGHLHLNYFSIGLELVDSMASTGFSVASC